MIKSWNFINTKYSSFFIAGRPLEMYSRDSADSFVEHSISGNFDDLHIFISTNLVGLTPAIFEDILYNAAELPICCKMGNETVLYITSDADSKGDDKFPDIDPSGKVIDLGNLKGSDDLRLINNAESLAEFNAYIQEHLYQKALRSEVYILDKQSVYFAYDTVFGKNTIIEPNVYFGNGVMIENNVTIKSFSYLEGVVIRDNVTIGPFARIRPQSEIQQNAKIGNFVEVKNSVLGRGSKAGHLSYLGDSNIGSEVNIGAGVVTCNYDGQKKYKTIIGNNAFIGTNTAIIAPITIGNNTLIGAGSFINKDVPDDHFAIGRSKQQNKFNRKNK